MHQVELQAANDPTVNKSTGVRKAGAAWPEHAWMNKLSVLAMLRHYTRSPHRVLSHFFNYHDTAASSAGLDGNILHVLIHRHDKKNQCGPCEVALQVLPELGTARREEEHQSEWRKLFLNTHRPNIPHTDVLTRPRHKGRSNTVLLYYRLTWASQGGGDWRISKTIKELLMGLGNV